MKKGLTPLSILLKKKQDYKMWQEYFGDCIAIINLAKRKDRLVAVTKVLDDLGIYYEVWEATDDVEKPVEGLVDSMQRYFREVLDRGGERCLVFEDDVLPLVDEKEFNETMEKCIAQLPEDWDLFYLGCNIGNSKLTRFSENLISLSMAYATHAVCYSKRAMEFVVNRDIKEPFDNCLVRDFQPNAKVFCSYPLLLTQAVGYSDINKSHTDWSRFIEVRFNSEIKKIIQ